MLIVGTLAAAVLLLWRLNSGPISIAYLTPYFESALSSETGRFEVRIEDTILDWSQEARTLNVKLIGARVVDAGGTTVIQAPELLVSLSAAALLRGQFAPRSLSISGASIRITRTEHGDFDLGTEGGSLAAGEGAAVVISDLMAPHDSGDPISYLARVNILDAHLTINDRLLNVEWSVPDVNISLVRNDAGISGVTDFELKIGNHVASLQINADYRMPGDDLTVTIGFADLRPQALASVTDALSMLAPIDVPLSGTLVLDFAGAREIARAEFNIEGGPGRVAVQGPIAVDVALAGSRLRGIYDAAASRVTVDDMQFDFGANGSLMLPAPIAHAFPVRTLTASAIWWQDLGRLDIGSFRLTLDKPVLEGTAAFQRSDGGITMGAAAQGAGLTFEDLAKYWPATLARDPRSWVLRHIPSGRASEARTHVVARWSETSGFQLDSIGGELHTNDAVVDYLPPMPKVVKGAVHARFDRQKFDIAVLGGESAGLSVRGGRIVIDDLDKVDQWTDIDLAIEGPLDAALAYIDSKPFEFAKGVGLSPKAAKGTTSTRLKLRFIAENKLTLDQIKIGAESVIKDAALPGVAFGLDLTSGDLKLSANNAGMDVGGNAFLNGIGSELAWRQNFAPKAPFASRYRLKAEADARDWREKMDLDWPLLGADALSGPVRAELALTRTRDGGGTVTADVDLDRADMSLALLGWSKPSGERSRVSLEAALRQGRVAAFPKIAVVGGGLTFDGEAVFASDGKIASARIAKLAVGETDIAGAVFPRGGGWEIDIHGPKLDLKHWMEDKTPEDPNARRGDALAVSVNVGRVRLYEDRYLGSVSGALNYDGLVWREARLSGALEGGGTLTVELTPESGRRKVMVSSDNAGGVLSAFDVNDNVIGGRLTITGAYGDMAPASCLGGLVVIDDYRVRNAPVLTQLLNAASVVGLLESLGGEGIKFDSLRIPFTKKASITRFENAKASGLSIGLTASGSVNTQNETVEIEGSLVPANLINSILGKIPLVGRVFGGEGGVFAIDYKITGNKSEPDVRANPLTVLTPGFTRQIFSIFERKDEEAAPVGCPKAG